MTFDEFRTNLKRDLELLSVANPRLVNLEVAAAVDLSDGFGTGGRLVAQILGDFGSQVMRECVNSDGRVSVVDIKRANLYAHARWLAVGHGIRGGFSSAGCISWNNVAGFSFPGVYRLGKHWARMKADFTLLDAMIVQREKLLSEIEKSPNAGISRIYEEAVSRYPATMSVASGIVGTRLFHGQFI